MNQKQEDREKLARAASARDRHSWERFLRASLGFMAQDCAATSAYFSRLPDGSYVHLVDHSYLMHLSDYLGRLAVLLAKPREQFGWRIAAPELGMTPDEARWSKAAGTARIFNGKIGERLVLEIDPNAEPLQLMQVMGDVVTQHGADNLAWWPKVTIDGFPRWALRVRHHKVTNGEKIRQSLQEILAQPVEWQSVGEGGWSLFLPEGALL